MFQLLSIQQTKNATTKNVDGEAIRCVILADNTSDTLPETGKDVKDMGDDQTFLPGSIAVTPSFNLAMVDNNGKWGDWS